MAISAYLYSITILQISINMLKYLYIYYTEITMEKGWISDITVNKNATLFIHYALLDFWGSLDKLYSIH